MVIAKIIRLFIDENVKIPPAQQYNGSYMFIPNAKRLGYEAIIKGHFRAYILCNVLVMSKIPNGSLSIWISRKIIGLNIV